MLFHFDKQSLINQLDDWQKYSKTGDENHNVPY